MSRVLLVGKGAPDRGGIAAFLADLCSGELARQHEVTFLNVAHQGTPEGGRATWGNLARTVMDAVRVWRASAGQDVVHINSSLAPTVTAVRAGLLAIAARLRGCTVLVHVHGGNLETWLPTRGAATVVRVSTRPAHRVLAVWSTGHRLLAEVLGAERVQLVDNGVDTARFRARQPVDRQPRILYVGLLTPRKGVLDLITASAMLQQEGVAHELLLVGGTPDEGPAAAAPVLAAARGSAALLGTRPPEQMPDVYPEGDVFCLPSWWEAMPLSVLEAMACGLPVVATAVGDVPRLVEDGVTGYVVPARSPDALADALRKLLSDPAQRRRMGAAGRQRVEARFSSDTMAREIGQQYSRIQEARA